MYNDKLGPCDCTYSNGSYTCFSDPITGAGGDVVPACPTDESTGVSCAYDGGQCMFCGTPSPAPRSGSVGLGVFCSCNDGGSLLLDGALVEEHGPHWFCSPLGSPTCQVP